MNTVLNYQDFIQADGDELSTTSTQIAAAFGKRHADVLRAIERVRSGLPDERQRHFALTLAPVPGPNGSIRYESAYTVTRDGFTVLAMGFTGKKAQEFKWSYIDAFNAMAAHIKNQREGLSYRRAAHELACKDSARRGSYHGKGLNERKQEIRALNAEEVALMAASCPPLFLN